SHSSAAAPSVGRFSYSRSPSAWDGLWTSAWDGLWVSLIAIPPAVLPPIRRAHLWRDRATPTPSAPTPHPQTAHPARAHTPLAHPPRGASARARARCPRPVRRPLLPFLPSP